MAANELTNFFRTCEKKGGGNNGLKSTIFKLGSLPAYKNVMESVGACVLKAPVETFTYLELKKYHTGSVAQIRDSKKVIIHSSIPIRRRRKTKPQCHVVFLTLVLKFFCLFSRVRKCRGYWCWLNSGKQTNAPVKI